MVLKATCLLYGYEENWENAKRYLLGDIRFLEKLIGSFIIFLEFDVTVTNVVESRFIKLNEFYFKKDEFKRENIVK